MGISLVVTSPLSVWQNTLLLPACCWPCKCKSQSQKGSDLPEPEHRARLPLAPWSLCLIQSRGSHSEAIAPSAGGNLKNDSKKKEKASYAKSI